MSIKSYQRNVAKGAAGENLPICFPASLEQLAAGYSYDPHLYDEYVAFVDYHDSLSDTERRQKCEEYEHVLESLVEPFGGLTLDDLVMQRVKSAKELIRSVNRLHAQGYSIVVDVRYGNWNPERVGHSVGLVEVEPGYVTLLSNHIPPKLRGVVSLAQVGEQLAYINDSPLPGHPLHTANLVAFPNA